MADEKKKSYKKNLSEEFVKKNLEMGEVLNTDADFWTLADDKTQEQEKKQII